MKKDFYEKYKVQDNRYENEKIKIIENNKKKTVYEIKKKIKKKYPDITNEEMMHLIARMNENRTLKNIKKAEKMKKKTEKIEKDER